MCIVDSAHGVGRPGQSRPPVSSVCRYPTAGVRGLWAMCGRGGGAARGPQDPSLRRLHLPLRVQSFGPRPGGADPGHPAPGVGAPGDLHWRTHKRVE